MLLVSSFCFLFDVFREDGSALLRDQSQKHQSQRLHFGRSGVKQVWTLLSDKHVHGAPRTLRRLPPSRVRRPTWPVRRTCVGQMYGSPGAVCAHIMEHLTRRCIYDSIKALHKDEAPLCSPFIRLSSGSLGRIYGSTPRQEVDKWVDLMERRGDLKGEQKVSGFCQSVAGFWI